MKDLENPNALLLTEDGHPIGELVIADDTSVPAMPNEETVNANREELMRESAVACTGAPDADAAVAELYPGYSDPDIRKKAMILYVTEARSIEEVAGAVGVPGRTVAMWIYNGQWDDLVKREVSARQSQSVLALARLRAAKRLEIAREQFDQAKMIRDKAAGKIRRDEGSLKSNTESWTAAAKVEHTLSGVSEAGQVADIEGKNEEEKKDGNGGKSPLVMIFQGGLPPVRRPQ